MARDGIAIGALVANRPLLRLAAAWSLFVLAEYGVWIAMLVYAYQRGGTTAAGVIAVVQLLPGVIAGPLLSTVADRRSPTLLLVGGYLVQTAGMALAAAAMYAHAPAVLAYAGGVVAATAVTATRPAQAAILPALARTARELATANVAISWLESTGIVLAGVIAGIALGGGQPGLVVAICAGATLGAAVLAGGVRVAAILAPDDDVSAGAVASALAGLAVLRRHRASRLLVAVLGVQFVVVGALDVLFVVLAVAVSHRSTSWTGYFNAGYGFGGVLAGGITLWLVGRRLAPALVFGAGAVALPLAATAYAHRPLLTLLLLVLVGLGRAVLETAAHTLLQRTVPTNLLGRMFGIIEGLSMAGLAVGSILVPILVRLTGTTGAVIGVAALLPAALVAGARTLAALDGAAHVPVVEIALFRSIAHFRLLPTPVLEALARVARRREFGPGQTIIREGDRGDDFFVIADGQVRVLRGCTDVGSQGRGTGFGEIALLRSVPRSATVVADGPVVTYALDGEEFVRVVTGHDGARARTEEMVTGYLDEDGARGASERPS
jgi:cyclic nucleotide-binding protein/MFS transporter